ncbi:MAG: hypothetical protein R3A12_02285 [Ignavibacteria bacterium]
MLNANSSFAPHTNPTPELEAKVPKGYVIPIFGARNNPPKLIF